MPFRLIVQWKRKKWYEGRNSGSIPTGWTSRMLDGTSPSSPTVKYGCAANNFLPLC